MDENDKLIFQQSASLRGLVLDATVDIERKIGDFLTLYFCDDISKGNQLKEMLLNTERITLGSKTDILFIILKDNYKKFLDEYSEFSSTLNRIIPHRNIFAHLEVDYSASVSDKKNIGIAFKKYKSGKLELRKYGDVDIHKLKEDFIYLNSALDSLIASKKMYP